MPKPPADPESHRLIVTITPWQRDALVAAAAHRGSSVSDVLRLILIDWINRNGDGGADAIRRLEAQAAGCPSVGRFGGVK